MKAIQKQANRLKQLDKSQLEKIIFKLLKQQLHRSSTIKLIEEEYNSALGDITMNKN